MKGRGHAAGTARQRIDRVTVYDIAVVAVVVLLAWRGFRVGLLSALLTWVALGVGLVLALRFDRVVGGWISHVHEFAPTTQRVLAFVAILVVVEIAVGWLAGRLSRLLSHIPVLGGANRLAGLLLGALLAVATVWLVTAALLALPSALPLLSNPVRHSETAHLLRSLTPRWQQEMRTRFERLRTGGL